MNTSPSFSSLLIGTLIVVAAILVWAALQGLGSAFESGVNEWLVAP